MAETDLIPPGEWTLMFYFASTISSLPASCSLIRLGDDQANTIQTFLEMFLSLQAYKLGR